ncbi:hypothetical protein FRC04_006379 [Tulasnella sp. 424]|nr:hypothetical protein FRC04_006379 [Tulasnella sp. 424]KAG8980430.1 hypothetical protein FRC05_006062 [Tulasnella sp. 425]
MPYLDLSKDKISIWYTTNLKNDNIANLDRTKPTILILHGMFLNTRFLAPQFNDPRLNDNFNLIAYDAMSCGKTKNPVSPHNDLWCQAALIAQVSFELKLPPFHLMANGMNPVAAALRFNILFPGRCLSMSLNSIPGPLDIDWCAKAYTDLLQLWSFAPNLEQIEEACMEVAFFLFGENVLTKEQTDEVIGMWMQAWPPGRRSHLLDIAALISGRVPLTQAEYDRITVPTFLVTGDSSVVHTVQMAEELQESLRNARGGCKLQVIRGGQECLHLPQSSAGFVNRFLCQFVTTIEREMQENPNNNVPSPLPKKLSDYMKGGLDILAELMDDQKVKKREAKSIFSFSRTPPEGAKGMEAFIGQFKNGEKQAYSPLGKDGQPLRKFSERHDNQLFLSPQHGNLRDHSTAVGTMIDVPLVE